MSNRNDSALSAEEIDRIVEAEDDSGWEEAVHVQPPLTASVKFSGDLVARAAFLARLHREKSLKAWLHQIIKERIEIEERAYAAVKRELELKASV